MTAASHKLPNGLSIFHVNGGETRFLYDEIFRDRLYARHGLLDALPAAPCIFDVGANIGMSALFFHLERPAARFYLFEPGPGAHDALVRNVELHQLSARVFDCGIAAEAGTAMLTYYANNTVMSGLHANPDEDRRTTRQFMINSGFKPEAADAMLKRRFQAETLTCQLRTISDVISAEHVDRIDLLKIDVEKSELAVLAGIGDADWARISSLVAEVHDLDGRVAEIRAMLERRGFEVVVEQDAQFQSTECYDVFARRAARS